MLPNLFTAFPEEFAETGGGTLYVGCTPWDSIRALATVYDGVCHHVSIHGLAREECYFLDTKNNPRPW